MSEPEALPLETLREVERRVLGLATAIGITRTGAAQALGVKVGGHQASSASTVTIMTSLWFRRLRAADRVSGRRRPTGR